ncbi:hypothetical protein FJR38_24945 [Anabaena sp. UHCC 0253]|uniref:hypothetical protein n=1 Tax=Anabaena sp. UHCC 0253 TaxID=2590019 RepID=UPI001C2C22ED|nr:hypothetical protein [Anabaena sp. UHCC 0253]MTJ55678.1 hypothetical protein [Anabaena sp. UHCC 0253]
MRKYILYKMTDFAAKRFPYLGLARKSGVVILGSLIGIWLMPTNPAISQSPIFHGVPISQKFNVNSDLADLIKKMTKKYFESSGGRFKGSTYRLGQWLLVPGGEGNYSTYEATIMSFDTTNPSDKPIKSYVIHLLTDTTTNNPKSFQFGVDCPKNKLKFSSSRTYSSSGETIDRQLIDRPWDSPTNQYIQNLVNGVCRLGS